MVYFRSFIANGRVKICIKSKLILFLLPLN